MWTKWLMCCTLWHIRALHPTTAEYILFSNAHGIPKLTISWIIKQFPTKIRQLKYTEYVLWPQCWKSIKNWQLENSHVFRNQEIHFQKIQGLKKKAKETFKDIFTWMILKPQLVKICMMQWGSFEGN